MLLDQVLLVPVVLELDVEPDTTAGKVQDLGQCGDGLAGEAGGEPGPGVQSGQGGMVQLPDPAGVPSDPLEVLVVEQDQGAVPRLLNIDFHPVGTLSNGKTDGAEGVFRGLGGTPAVGGDQDLLGRSRDPCRHLAHGLILSDVRGVDSAAPNHSPR